MPASSRLKPKVIWVRSLVPKEKNCASLAISSAVNAARGISIIVPTRYFSSIPASAMIESAVAVMMFLTNTNSFTSPTSGTMISGTTVHSGWRN